MGRLGTSSVGAREAIKSVREWGVDCQKRKNGNKGKNECAWGSGYQGVIEGIRKESNAIMRSKRDRGEKSDELSSIMGEKEKRVQKRRKYSAHQTSPERRSFGF